MLRAAGLDLEEATTRSPQEGMAIAQRAGGDGFATVISVGGDGTTHWAVNGLLQSGAHPRQIGRAHV